MSWRILLHISKTIGYYSSGESARRGCSFRSSSRSFAISSLSALYNHLVSNTWSWKCYWDINGNYWDYLQISVTQVYQKYTCLQSSKQKEVVSVSCTSTTDNVGCKVTRWGNIRGALQRYNPETFFPETPWVSPTSVYIRDTNPASEVSAAVGIFRPESYNL